MQNKAMPLIILGLLLAACEKNIKLEYVPATQVKVTGVLTLGYFKYSPAVILKENQPSVRNANLKIFLDKNVSSYFADSVKQELEFAGIAMGGGALATTSDQVGTQPAWRQGARPLNANYKNNCRLDVVIDEFSYDNWGLAGHYIVKADYVISDASDKPIFKHHGETDVKSYNPFNSHEEKFQEAAATSIQTFIADPGFAEIVASRCGG